MAGDMPLWMQILWGIGAVMILIWFLPGVKAAMEKTRTAENKDWMGLLIPIVVVVLFVFLLISLVRS